MPQSRSKSFYTTYTTLLPNILLAWFRLSDNLEGTRIPVLLLSILRGTDSKGMIHVKRRLWDDIRGGRRISLLVVVVLLSRSKEERDVAEGASV